jgi:hypothetical protein
MNFELCPLKSREELCVFILTLNIDNSCCISMDFPQIHQIKAKYLLKTDDFLYTQDIPSTHKSHLDILSFK